MVQCTRRVAVAVFGRSSTEERPNSGLQEAYSSFLSAKKTPISIRYRPGVICIYRKRVGGRKKYVMTLKEMNRLKSNGSATSSICTPYDTLSPLSPAMAMPEHPYLCMKPLEHESCDMRNALTNP